RTLVTSSLAALVVSCSAPDEQSTPQAVATVQAELETSLAAGDETANVIVNLRPAPRGSSFAERRAYHRRLQEGILDAYGDGFTLSRRFEHVPAIAGSITKAALDRLRRDPNVAYVQLDGIGRGQLKEAVPAIGADKVHSMYGLTGK